MAHRILNWYDNLPTSLRLCFLALFTALPFYFSAFLSYSVSQTANLQGYKGLGLHSAIFIVLLAIVVFIYRYITFLRQEKMRATSERNAAIMHAHAQSERLIIDDLMKLNNVDIFGENFQESFLVSIKDVQRIVQAAYNTFEGSFGKSNTIEQRIDFEVTFMTKSYTDNEITIPASANREGRAPGSMILRENNPKIYDNTVTASVYRETRPTIHIIEDTLNSEAGYHEIYSGQTDRIKSSIIYPVFSDKNILLGTLVVHCDKPGYFKKSDAKYWIEILEIFSKRIALCKLKLDMIVNHLKTADTENIKIKKPIPLF